MQNFTRNNFSVGAILQKRRKKVEKGEKLFSAFEFARESRRYRSLERVHMACARARTHTCKSAKPKPKPKAGYSQAVLCMGVVGGELDECVWTGVVGVHVWRTWVCGRVT